MAFLKIKKVIRPEDNFEMECVNKPNAVAVVIFNKDYSKILLTEQFRAGSNNKLLEIPAGVVEDDETYKEAAYREVREETGYDKSDIEELEYLGEYYCSPGYTSEKIILFVTRLWANAKQKEQALDEHEKLTLKWVDTIQHFDDMKTKLGVTMALARPKLKIGLFGGTFNPITYLHLSTMERAIEELNLDNVIVEPVNNSYHKADIISYKHRCEMIQKAISNNPKMKLGTFEIDQLLQPQTIETLNYYKDKFGWCELYFICGSDVLKDSETWPQVEKILKDFNIICIQRDNQNVYRDIILKSDIFLKYKNKIHIIYENTTNNISSSIVRKLIKNNQSAKYLIPDSVNEYILKNNLYK